MKKVLGLLILVSSWNAFAVHGRLICESGNDKVLDISRFPTL